MQKYVFDWRQGPVLLEHFERVRAELTGDVCRPVMHGPAANALFGYFVNVNGRPNVVVDQESSCVTLNDGKDRVTLRVLCVHDCGSCVSNRYTLEFDDGSKLAERILEKVPPPSTYMEKDAYVDGIIGMRLYEPASVA